MEKRVRVPLPVVGGAVVVELVVAVVVEVGDTVTGGAVVELLAAVVVGGAMVVGVMVVVGVVVVAFTVVVGGVEPVATTTCEKTSVVAQSTVPRIHCSTAPLAPSVSHRVRLGTPRNDVWTSWSWSSPWATTTGPANAVARLINRSSSWPHDAWSVRGLA